MKTNDPQLPASATHDRDGSTFQRIVERHIDFVYAAALRQTGDTHIAEDITQAVFLLFAQRAGRLTPETIVKGWLFNTTRYVVANFRRAEGRRKLHEREAAAMRSGMVHEDNWSDISPHLDDAMAGLSEKDRRALLLRFFEDMPLAALSQTLGISEEAAKKRVARALERLRHSLVRRGTVIASASLGTMLHATTAHPAPVHLVKATINLALNGASGPANSSSASTLAKGAAKMMIRARAKLLAIQFAIAGLLIGTAVVLATSQPRLIPSSPLRPSTGTVVENLSDTSKVDDDDYNACRQVLKSIVDAYDHNDVATVQALYYYKPGSDPKAIDVMDRILEAGVATYRLKSAAVSRFGIHGTMLKTDTFTGAEFIMDVLSRISPQNATIAGDTLTIKPSKHTGPAEAWEAPIYFLHDQGAWKMDAARTFRVVFRAVRREPIADESREQTFAAACHQLATEFDATAVDIDKGNIPDEAGAQKRVNAAWDDLNSQFREFGNNTMPR